MFEDAALEAETLKIASRLADEKPWAARLSKQNLNVALHGTLRDCLAREALSQTLAAQALGAAMKQAQDNKGAKPVGEAGGEGR